MPPLTDEQLWDYALGLRSDGGSRPVAMCQLASGELYFSRYEKVGKEPYDAGSTLIQGLLTTLQPKDLNGAVIATTYEPDTMLEGMLAMLTRGATRIAPCPATRTIHWGNVDAAKKQAKPSFKGEVKFDPGRDELKRFVCPVVPSPGLDLASEDNTPHMGYHTVHRVYLMAAYALLRLHDVSAPDGKYVAAILVDKEGRILGWGLNTNKTNKTLHAEVNMLQSYYKYAQQPARRSGIPEGARIYSTLQCCKMCSGMIVATAQKPDTIRVYYGMTDPTASDETALTKRKLDKQLSGKKGEAIRGIKVGATDDLSASIDADYTVKKNTWINGKRQAGDAASFGSTAPYQDVATAVKTKYERHYGKDAKSVKNPNVSKALEQVRSFLNHLSLVHLGESFFT
jgi:tRNA(Arg) A34 adenosine deaminase TadA